MTEANTSRPGRANVEGRAVSDDNTPIRLIASTSSTSPAKPTTAGPLRPSVQRPVAPWRSRRPPMRPSRLLCEKAHMTAHEGVGPFGSQCLRAPVSRATGCRPFRRPARGRVAHLAIERSGPCSTAAIVAAATCLPPPAAYTVTGDRMMGRRTGETATGEEVSTLPEHARP